MQHKMDRARRGVIIKPSSAILNEGVEAKEEDPQEETKQKKEDMYDQIL